MAEAPRSSHGLIDTSVMLALENIDAAQVRSKLAISARPWQSSPPAPMRRAMPASERDVKIPITGRGSI